MQPGKGSHQQEGCHQPASPQQILASVSAGLSDKAQRLTQHLHTHILSRNPLQIPSTLQLPYQPISQRTLEASSRRNQVLVEEEGVTVTVQARHNVHKTVFALGATLWGKLGRLGHKLKQHHVHAREEGELRRAAKRERRRHHSEHAEHNPLKFALPWQRKRRGHQHDGGIFLRGGPQAKAKALIKKGQEHERELDVRAAVRCYEEANKQVPGVADTLCLAAKAWSDTCYMDEIQSPFKERLTMQDRHDVNKKAMEYAKQAMVLAPNKALPHVAACISMGRLAVFSDNKTKVRLAKEARELAVVAMQKEPQDDLAQHLMGRWHWEMAQLSGIARALVRIIFGTELPTGTHAEALQHYRRASELNPGRMIHKVELGRALAKLGQREAALKELEQALTMDVEDINAHLQKIDAEILVKQFRQKQKRYGAVQPVPAQRLQASGMEAAGGKAARPQPWQWPQLPSLPQLPNPFSRSHPERESPDALNPCAATAAPMPASVTQKQPKQAQTSLMPQQSASKEQVRGGSKGEAQLHGSRAAQDGQAAQRPFWQAPPWGQKHAAPSPASDIGDRSDSTSGSEGRAQGGAKQAGGGWKLPMLRNPFEGWGRSVSPGES
ncbi:hypothetical protein CVIRNUC_003724 [Coccomyxa viridis]|uniref:Regulator of microtubule dynamics protein 1 n=1 Tax=Coccomyxa viridis TaxID=1274662 RepID=A0AAV1I0G6_9CHLO|nr:hypothetical protein CVIRNUC_003724 [Coccomyxa viridis]